MRKLMLLMAVGLLVLPVALWAQPERCDNCLLGIWNEPEMINNTGTITAGVPKDLIVGIRLAESEPGITGIEFSISGIRAAEDGILILPIEAVSDPGPAVIIGNPSVAAPADTSEASTEIGGSNIAWATCVSGTRPLVKVPIIYTGGTPLVNKVLKVLRRYPPTNLANPDKLFTRCDVPLYTSVLVPGGCFILNWDGSTNPVSLCEVETAVETNTWTGMKQLYR